MRSIVTLVSLGLAGWGLAGCEQQQDTLEPATGLPQSESPSTDTDIQIGRGDPVETDPQSDPVAPPVEREIEPNVIRPGDEQGAGELEPQTEPAPLPDPQN